MNPKWLQWARKLQAIAQTGLAYDDNPFDIERYESVRAVASEMMAAHTEADVRSIRDMFAKEEGYATPKVAVQAAVFQDHSILLVKERQDGLWTLPGGWADVGETPSEAIVREVREESGYETRASKLLAVYNRDSHGLTPLPFHVYTLYFGCELLGGEPAPSVETEDAAFFNENEIPELSIARVTPAQIARLFEHHYHADWPADFD